MLIKAVTVQGLSYGEVAKRFGVSKSLVHKLHHRWLEEGDAAFQPYSRRPTRSPNQTPATVRERVRALRQELIGNGMDAGADTIAELLAREGRPHRALSRRTPQFAYQLIPKATPTPPGDPGLWRVRYDTIDLHGKISLRHHGRMLHLGIGRAHARTEIICLIHNNDATISTHDGTVLAEYVLDPTRDYQRKNG